MNPWVLPEDLRQMRLITIGSGESHEGPRLGGRPPDGVLDDRMTDECRYFASIPVCDTPALELSIFINRDFRTLLKTRRELIRDDRVLLLCHTPRRRSQSSAFASELSEHPLLLGPVVSDCSVDDQGEEIVDSRHKLGGRPYTIQEPAEDLAGTSEAAQLGMRQYLQFDTPDGSERVRGSWPWGNGIFHVFVRGSLCAAEWASFWES